MRRSSPASRSPSSAAPSSGLSLSSRRSSGCLSRPACTAAKSARCCRSCSRRRSCSWPAARWRISCCSRSLSPVSSPAFRATPGGGGAPIELLPRVGEYLDLVMKLIFACGLDFPAAGRGFVACQSRYHQFEARYGATGAMPISGMFVIAAVVAPPDPLSSWVICFARPVAGALRNFHFLRSSLVEPKPKED